MDAEAGGVRKGGDAREEVGLQLVRAVGFARRGVAGDDY